MGSILSLFRPEVFITTLGPLALFGIFAVVFVESGVLFFFLPGDSLLFTAGLLASQGYFNLFVLLAVCFVAAVLGDNVGYWLGKTLGQKLFNREDSFFFKKHHIVAAQDFYAKHGPKTIVLSRFVPFVRTFAPLVAGAANMHYHTFMIYNLAGGFLWAIGITLMGYFLGNIPLVHKYNELVIILIVVASIIPVALHILQDLRSKKSAVSSN